MDCDKWCLETRLKYIPLVYSVLLTTLYVRAFLLFIPVLRCVLVWTFYTGRKAQSCKVAIKQEDSVIYRQWEITVLEDLATFLSYCSILPFSSLGSSYLFFLFICGLLLILKFLMEYQWLPAFVNEVEPLCWRSWCLKKNGKKHPKINSPFPHFWVISVCC